MGSKIIGARIQSDKVKIIEMYESGVDITEIADKYNLKVNTLCQRLRRWGVKIRGGDWHKKEIYPWCNILSEEEKMEIYFKYFTTGTYNDCEEWWWELNVEEKIKVFNDWYEEEK